MESVTEGVLGGKTQKVLLQFILSQKKAVRRMEDETRLGHETRKGFKSDSWQFITPTDKVSAKGILSALENAGFSLTDAIYQRRLKGNSHYHMAQFVFTRKGVECTPHPEFVWIAKIARINMARMLLRCTLALPHLSQSLRRG